jgi:hypothetical protein
MKSSAGDGNPARTVPDTQGRGKAGLGTNGPSKTTGLMGGSCKMLYKYTVIGSLPPAAKRLNP